MNAGHRANQGPRWRERPTVQLPGTGRPGRRALRGHRGRAGSFGGSPAGVRTAEAPTWGRGQAEGEARPGGTARAFRPLPGGVAAPLPAQGARAPTQTGPRGSTHRAPHPAARGAAEPERRGGRSRTHSVEEQHTQASPQAGEGRSGLRVPSLWGEWRLLPGRDGSSPRCSTRAFRSQCAPPTGTRGGGDV